MMEWIQFAVTAFFLIAGLLCFISEVVGVFRFGFVMNRMHASGIGDTLGIFCIVTGCMVSSGLNMTTLKLLLLVLFMWFSSPASTHFLSQIEYYTNESLYDFMKRK